MNKYDLEHVTTGHSVMTSADWQEVYRRAWDLYYSAEHIETIFRRAKASGIKPVRLLNHILQFYFTFLQENVQPLQGAISWANCAAAGLPCEAPLSFCATAGRGSRLNPRQVCAAFTYLHRIRLDVERDPGPIATPHFRRSTANSSRHAARRGC